MPMEDAMVLVGHNYDSFKVEHREKEREEIAQKAAKMADDVLMREHEREGHPVTLLPAITLLSEGRSVILLTHTPYFNTVYYIVLTARSLSISL